jgi:hypothetical protein
VKSHIATLVIALVVGFLGGISSRFWSFGPPAVAPLNTPPESHRPNPFQIQSESSALESRIADMQQQINGLELQLNNVTQQQYSMRIDPEDTAANSTEASTPRLPVASARDNLVAAGVNSDFADDILRRISQQQYRSMELQNLIRGKNLEGRQQYREELRELGEQKISLRSELGDDTYDLYLIASGGSNRVKISSVMAGSPAESNGFQLDDVILYYGDKRIIELNDLQKAAWGGDSASSVNVEILRAEQRMSLTVPGGTMGVRLEPIQLDATQ